MKSGNHWLRAQKSNETKLLEDVEYPPKRDKSLFHYFKILECCNFFAAVSDKKSIALLTSDNQGPTSQTFLRA